MNIIERGEQFLQSLSELIRRTGWEWRHCPYCGDSITSRWGFYERRPWFFEGRKTIRVQRHMCHQCKATYSEQSALLVRGSWYAREVHRCALDHWQHLGSSLRRSAEVLRSWMGKQERWLLWRPWDKALGERCYLSASTVHRWLDGAGKKAQKEIADQLDGVASCGQVGTDGLWARLKGGSKKVVLALVDSASGLIWPPVVVDGEESAKSWEELFERAKQAGLELDELRGVASDGAKGLIGYLNHGLVWVNHQRCVFHLWRNLSGKLASAVKEASTGLTDEVAKGVKKQVREELVALVRGVMDASSEADARTMLAQLAAHQYGQELVPFLSEHLEVVLVHRRPFNQGLMRSAEAD